MTNPVVSEVSMAAYLKRDDKSQCQRHGDPGLDTNADPGVTGDDFLHDAVEAEGEGQSQPDQRGGANLDGQHDDRDRGDEHRGRLSQVGSLAENQHSEKDAHQRIDEIAQRGVHDMAVGDRIYVDQPVHRNED